MKKNETKVNVQEIGGNITLGDRVRVTDPCYSMDVWCSGTIDNVLPGEYIPTGIISDEGSWGMRVAKIRVNHVNYPKRKPNELVDFEVGVDSGQAGIFDEPYYIEHHKDRDYYNPASWYRKVCDITLGTPGIGTVDGKGLVSSSGFGDGGYDALIARNEDGKVVAIEINYL